MMFIYRYTIRSFLILRYLFHRLSRTGCFGPGRAVRSVPTPSDRKGPSLRAGLFRHHVKQFHESSCSVASVVSVVNTLIERQFPPLIRPVTQQQLLEEVREAHWKERMGPDGYRGKRGLPLEILGRVVRASIAAYGIDARVDVIQARGGREAGLVKNRLITHLMDFQVRDNCLIIAHFDQGSLVQELNIPHISPVGGFDPETGQVTILDVDSSQPSPYRIPFARFYRGISTHYGRFFTPFGYGRGGYVCISLS